MRKTLFRQEAVDFSRATLVGQVLAARRFSFAALTGFAVIVIALVVALFVFGQYTRKVHVSGYLAPSTGLIKVYAGQAGTLVDKRVREGQSVRRGETLYVLSTERGSPEAAATQTAAIQTIKQRQASLAHEHETQAGIVRMQVVDTQQRLASMGAELQQLQAAATRFRQRVAGAERELARYEGLAAQQFIADTQVQGKRDDLIDQQTRLNEMLRAQIVLERDIRSQRQELAAVDLKAATERARNERDLAQLMQLLTESESRRTVLVTAPIDGTATAVLGDQGQGAGPQTLLLSILPADAELQARLLVPSRAIGFLAQGGRVSMRYQAFPYQRFGSFGGHVREIPRTMTAPGEADMPVVLNESVYRVSVVLEAQAVHTGTAKLPLQAGMLLEADLWLERRRLFEWLFEPVATVARRV
jgi:membrane fusion protein